MSKAIYAAPRTALFLPASNARAIEKARGLKADMVILDLEDAVKAADKEAARAMAVEAVAAGMGGKLTAIRINGADSGDYGADMVAVRDSAADFVVMPKVETPKEAADVHSIVQKPVLAMIETPLGVLAAAEIAALPYLQGLIVGPNDLAASLKLPPSAGRAQMQTALQLIVLAARAHGVWALDGVFNKLDDAEGLTAVCAEGRLLGFDGKTLIHPNQIDIARAAFDPTEAEVEEARELIAAANGGAERYKDRMIEDMHVAQAKALLARAAH
jgi:citrate lyase subunit beta/citryl-CoA lyase